ncbi:hypothetical protein [Acinetobacter sp. ANC 3813]|uniref:hypothetical protein n=1 Tax=Acinetobacter sp. ANC 3813 TaxID=1977873 RepID=UPI00148A5965|nr:hypothetical protein [Acinetobacter sp. ANC 3813]
MIGIELFGILDENEAKEKLNYVICIDFALASLTEHAMLNAEDRTIVREHNNDHSKI